MALPLVLQEIVANVKKQYETMPEVKWSAATPTEEDMAILQREALTENPFDKVNFRKQMWSALQDGSAELLCKVCSYGKVLVICMKNTELKTHISWPLWGRILQGFGLKNVRICWYASPTKRILPAAGAKVGPEHVNGGYTMACDTNAVVIYRLEEATRVLIHEMLHASCTDHDHDAVEIKEAKTETYAELFLIGYASKGKPALAERLWRYQAEWIQEVNQTLVHSHGVRSFADYSARYTLGRIGELEKIGLKLPGSVKRSSASSRFTSPKLDKFLMG
jgi:hypothetical protein